ncbi:unnamed protein product, partial [Scytosiphon promiscuus]
MDDGTILIKIGSTSDIKQRSTGLSVEFGAMAIIHTFECDDHIQFEKFLHQHIDIARHVYKDLVNGNKRSNEVFRMSPIVLEKAVNIAARNVREY